MRLRMHETKLSNVTPRSYWDIMNKIVHDEPPTFPAGCGASAEMCDFVACCLKKDPAERATVSRLMEHPWMQVHCAGLTSERKREHISIFIRDLRSIFVTNRSNHSCIRSSIHYFLEANYCSLCSRRKSDILVGRDLVLT